MSWACPGTHVSWDDVGGVHRETRDRHVASLISHDTLTAYTRGTHTQRVLCTTAPTGLLRTQWHRHPAHSQPRPATWDMGREGRHAPRDPRRRRCSPCALHGHGLGEHGWARGGKEQILPGEAGGGEAIRGRRLEVEGAGAMTGSQAGGGARDLSSTSRAPSPRGSCQPSGRVCARWPHLRSPRDRRHVERGSGSGD